MELEDSIFSHFRVHHLIVESIGNWRKFDELLNKHQNMIHLRWCFMNKDPSQLEESNLHFIWQSGMRKAKKKFPNFNCKYEKRKIAEIGRLTKIKRNDKSEIRRKEESKSSIPCIEDVLFFWMWLLCNFCCVVFFFSHGSFSKKAKILSSTSVRQWWFQKQRTNERKSISKSRKIDWSQCILTRHWRIFFIYSFLFFLFLCRISRLAKGCSEHQYIAILNG